MTTSAELLHKLRKDKKKKLGSGYYSNVYDLGGGKAIKVSNNNAIIDDGWLAFAYFCKEHREKFPTSLPLIHSIEQIDPYAYYAVMEKLAQDFEDSPFYKEKSPSRKSFDNFSDKTTVHSVKKLLKTMPTLTNADEFEEMFACLRLWGKKHYLTMDDLHPGNVMFRNSTEFVMTDPWYVMRGTTIDLAINGLGMKIVE